MLQIAPGWNLEVERGPDWLFVRPTWLSESCESPSMSDHGWESPPLTDHLLSLMRQNMTSRLVLECDNIPRIDSALVGQLLRLRRILNEQGGFVRLCGLSDENESVLRACGIGESLPIFRDRQEAVRGAFRPARPR